jgi:hypothetical protein
MSDEQKQTLGEYAYDKAMQYELDYGCCPQCAHATGTVTRWVIEML